MDGVEQRDGRRSTADYFDLLAGQGTKVTIRDREAEALDLKVFAVR